jgi:hypothetical protein
MFTINKLCSSSPADYAAEELKKYLRMMSPEGGDVKIAYDPEARDGFRLGLMCDLGLDTSDAGDVELDDIIYIDTDERGGIIAGSNPRSVLLAVYEYLRQLGCRWLFPGVDGEYIPMKDITPVKYRHKASSRIRGNCIEGYTSQDVILDFIDFMPKVGLNTFMFQCTLPATYYTRQYSHYHNNANRPPEQVSTPQIMQWAAEAECEMAKRGISYHAVGHGFTIDPFGISSAIGWGSVDGAEYPEDIMKYFALVNGKREFTKGRPILTQLCMSNPEARQKVVDYVVKYSRQHSNIDYLHVWLGDDENNHCECEECKKYRPSDLYVKMMNEMDDALTMAGLKTRIVVISYVDTLWAPLSEKLRESGRFALMLAPITRDYTEGYDKTKAIPPLRPYERNKLTFPDNLEESIAYYDEWKKNFSGDSFVFEYHFWKHQHFDLSGRMLARRIYDDVRSYRALGECGVLQCGSLRSFFPNGFAFYTHARALFDSSLSVDEIDRDYHESAYGENYGRFMKILEDIEEIMPYEYISPAHAKAREGKYATPDAECRLNGLREKNTELLALIKENYDSDARVRTASVRLLEVFSFYLDKISFVIEKMIENDKSAATDAHSLLEKEIGKYEVMTERCFDFGQATGLFALCVLGALDEKKSATEAVVVIDEK